MEEEEYWPDRIIAQIRVEYSPQSVKEQMAFIDGKEPTFEEVLDMIREFVKDDLSCGWGHQITSGEYILFDPDGDGVPNQAPPENAPTRQKGEPLEEHRFRVQEWRRLKDAYERYLQELRKYNDQRAKERKRRRP